MMFIRAEVIKRLAHEYQRTESPDVFEKILRRVDDLIIKTVITICTRYSYLGPQHLEDLYQTAVLSLYTCIRSVPEQEEARWMPVRIKAYIKSAIERDFIRPAQHHESVQAGITEVTDVSQYGTLDKLDDVMDLIEFLKHVVSIQEDTDRALDSLNLVVGRIAHGSTYVSLGKRWGISPQWAQTRCEGFFKVMQDELLFMQSDPEDPLVL